MSNIYIETYGCSTSQGEAEIMAGLLEQAGFNIIKNEKYAELIMIVTCYVKSPTEQKILFRIKQLQEFYPEKKLIIAGCMPEGLYNIVVDTAPAASLVSTHHIKEIVQAVKKTLQGKRVEYLGESDEVKLCLPRIRRNPIIDIVPISSGCDSACSYCCVRFAKGKLFSYPKEMIIKEIENSLKQGCKEIWLTAQDTASYELDNGIRLPELLNDISRIPGNFFVRVGMMNPKNTLSILSELIDSYKNKKIYKFLHLPIQSGNNEVLKRMNRNYKIEDFLKIIEEFKKNFNFQLWTDVIVGFPGETEEQFEDTIEILRKVKPDWTNVSKFGARLRTPAKDLKQIASKIISKRSERVSKLVREIALEKNKKWINWEGEVLISKKGKNPSEWIGRNFAYKPIVINSKENILGKIKRVKVSEITYSHLKSKIYM